jgi:hypothetical protein
MESSFLAEGGDPSTIVVREHLVSKNGISDLGSIQEIHLKQSSLLSTLIRSVVFQGIKEECSGWLNHILRKEDIDNTIDIHETATFFIGELICKLRSFLRI